VSGRNLATLPTISIGVPIKITADQSGNLFEMFHGVVSDVQINYGTLPEMDTWTIHCEDVLARLGRGLAPVGSGWTAGVTGFSAAVSTISQAFGSSITISGTNAGSLMSAQSIDNQNVLEVLNKLIATEQGWIYGLGPDTMRWAARADIGEFPLVGLFTDSSSPFPPFARYEKVEFRSQADSYYDEVVVEPDGLASQTAGSGSRVFTMSTYDQTTTQAKNLADYVLATLQVQNSVPSTITSTSETQVSNVAIDAARKAGTAARCRLGLRGSLYDLFIEGSTVTATPEQARFTLNVVSAQALNFFILDSASFGVLDTNKLGF
jgi:hypothetical protein